MKKYFEKEKVFVMAMTFNDDRTVYHMLKSQMININVTNEFGENALKWACKYGYDDIIDYCIETGCFINFQDMYGKTALIEAAAHDNLSAVKKLIKAGANTEIRDNINCSAFDYAKQNDNRQIMNELSAVKKREFDNGVKFEK